MKTQMNNYQETQALTNKLMLISILIFGGILFIVSGRNFWQNTFYQSRNSPGYFNHNKSITALIPLQEKILEDRACPITIIMESREAVFTDNVSQKLEVNKMRQLINENKKAVYVQMLNAIADVEEPELLMKDIFSELKTQNEYFEKLIDNDFASNKNTYLIDLYEKKNKRVLLEIENNWQAENYMMVDNDDALEIDVWIKNNKNWNVTEDGKVNFGLNLAEQLSEKNKTILHEIQLEKLIEKYSAVDTDDPLTLMFAPIKTWDVIEPVSFERKVNSNEFLASALSVKNAEILSSIKFERQYKEYLAIEIEEPLEVENWMVDARCWCPSKKKNKYSFTETFAYNFHGK